MTLTTCIAATVLSTLAPLPVAYGAHAPAGQQDTSKIVRSALDYPPPIRSHSH